MSIYDLYGVVEGDIESARAFLERAIQISFVPHESSFYGGEYFRIELPDHSSFMLLRNYNDTENEWLEEEYRGFPLLLYVNEHPCPDTVKDSLLDNLLNVSHLRRREIG